MKKRKQVIKKDNVFLFPDLDKRLIEKGLDQLKKKNFNDAIEYLSEAKQISPENEDVHVGLVLAYLESGNLNVAKQLVKEMLHTGIGEYFQIVDMYIMILIQQHQYEDVIATIGALFEEKAVPPEKVEHYTKLLELSNKKVSGQDVQESEQLLEVENEKLDLFSIHDPGEQIHLAGRLRERNIRYYIKEISDYLMAEKGHPFFKTMLLNLLKEQDYDKEIIVSKFGSQQTVIPNSLFDFHLHPDLIEASGEITKVLETENPILLDGIKQLMERFFLLLYPFRTEPKDPKIWAAAFHIVALEYFGQEENIEEMATLYQADRKGITLATAMIERLEEISSL